MVLKSFFRNKITIIYLTIITILIIAISFLFAAINYLDKINNEAYQKGSLVYIESNKDIYDELKNNKDVANHKEVVKFDYEDEELINKYYIFEYEVSEKILVYADQDNKYNLQDDEVVITIFDNNLSNQDKERYELNKNKSINFIFNNKNINFRIKNLEYGSHGNVIISKNLFNKLKKESNTYSYTVSFISKDKANNHNSIGNKEVDLVSEDDLSYSKKIEENMNYVKYASFICIGVFIIVTIVVNKNIICDFKNNMNLEVKLGYTSILIKMNILKRLFLLHLLSFIIAILISSIVVLIINIGWMTGISFDFISKNILLIFIILLSDIILSLILKTKNI